MEKRSSSAPARSSAFLRTCPTKPGPSKTPSTSIFSIPRAKTGSTKPTITCEEVASARGRSFKLPTYSFVACCALAPEKTSYAKERVMTEVVLKRFESPDEVRTFEKGKFEIVHLGGMTIGRATYEPGWRWSKHVGRALGQKECLVEHVGMVISGRATAAMSNGDVIEMRAGQVFYVPPGHDSWVVGDEPYVSLHFLGASEYASRR